MQLLKADTLTKVLVGPAVAVGDGFTPVTTLSLSTADEAEILKHDAAAVTDISGNTFAAITNADGYYNLTITAAQLDTEGRLSVVINDDSLILPIRVDFTVVNANVYDSLYSAAATDYLQVDTIQVSGATEDIATETNVSTRMPTTHIDATSGVVDGVIAVGSVAGAVGSVTGSVGSVAGNVGGNVAGSIGSLGATAKADVNAECDAALADYDGPTNSEMEARTPTAAQLAYIVSNSADGLPVTFTGGTTTTAILGNVDGAAASSTNDAYNGRVLVFNTGTLNQQATDITDYDGATKTATITAVTTAVTAAHTANLK